MVLDYGSQGGEVLDGGSIKSGTETPHQSLSPQGGLLAGSTLPYVVTLSMVVTLPTNHLH